MSSAGRGFGFVGEKLIALDPSVDLVHMIGVVVNRSPDQTVR